MVPPPPLATTFLPEHRVQLCRGQRRNFYQERFQHAHKFPIGTRVYMQMPFMSVPIGPLYITQYCQPLFYLGPPQYILQPQRNGDNSKWLQASERHIFEADTEEELEIPHIYINQPRHYDFYMDAFHFMSTSTPLN